MSAPPPRAPRGRGDQGRPNACKTCAQRYDCTARYAPLLSRATRPAEYGPDCMPYLGTIAEAFGPPGKRPYCVFVTQEEDLHTVQTRLEAFDSIPDQRDSPLRWGRRTEHCSGTSGYGIRRVYERSLRVCGFIGILPAPEGERSARIGQMLQLSPLAKEGCRVGDLILDADCSGQKGHDVTLIA